jgi:hypothetical protein
VKNAVNFIGEYEKALAAEARRRGVDGVICGHIHHAVMRQDFGLTYVNCGDWVESCTAVVEHFDGRLEIIRWIEREASADPSEPVLSDASAPPPSRSRWRSAAPEPAATVARSATAPAQTELDTPPAANQLRA